mmetsp:Transcript_117834/g.334071  ORF Transcript_117834/g.334071 Transcript_117834/m.334071 type:complete len:494 (-) Transcript_117834:104-1585(-)
MAAWSRWWERPRSRIANARQTGSVLEWRGHFGWIAPDTPIDHPEASKHRSRVYVNAKDVGSDKEPYEGARMSFFLYTDGDGVGAEEVLFDETPSESDAEDGLLSECIKGGAARGKGRWSRGGQNRVQRTIEKCEVGVGSNAGKDAGKGKGKGKDGARGGAVVVVPGPASGPDRSKAVHSGKCGVLSWASAEMRGWRPAMEDSLCTLLGLKVPLESFAMFGVFDGHGGAAVSKRAAEELPDIVVSCAEDLRRQGGTEEGLAEGALRAALPMLDDTLREDGAGTPGFLPMASCTLPIATESVNAYSFTGSTAVVALMEFEGTPEAGRPRRIVVANCGDSRAILCRGGEAVALSEDQKPDMPAERERIEKAGGFVAPVGPCQRIDGWGLNLSRALGDFHYKARDDLPPSEQKVTSTPEVMTCEVTEDDEFLFLGCDGVFELNSSQDAISHVRAGLLAGRALTQVVEDLVDSCCSSDLFQTQGHGSDNVSALVILLR